MKAKFIAIEGGEGSGKSTMLAALKEELGDRAVFTREPGGSPYGEEIRKVIFGSEHSKTASPATALALMFAARFDHLKNVIAPAISGDKHVISDRFDASSYAYNVHAQSYGDLENLFWHLRDELIRTPDLYVWLDVDPAIGLERARGRNEKAKGGNHLDYMTLEFHRSVRAGYERFFDRITYPVGGLQTVLKIDANRQLDVVKRNFLAQVKVQLGL